MSNSPMTVKAGEGQEFHPIEPGVYPARCCIVAGIGTQDSPYGPKDQAILVWELVDELKDFGYGFLEPAHLSGFYSLTLGSSEKPSNLRKILEGWRGRPFTAEEESGFELKNLAGKPCQVVVQHKQRQDGKLSAIIQSCVRAAEDKVKPLKEAPIYYDAWDHNEREFRLLPEWIQKKVVHPREAEEDPAYTRPTADGGFDPDAESIPF